MIENPELDSNVYANLVYDKVDISKQMHCSNNSNNDTIYGVIILFSYKCFNYCYNVIYILYVVTFVMNIILFYINEFVKS